VIAVILVAGPGRRLAPLTDGTPKCLLPVAGRPILSRLLDALHAVRVRDVTLVAGYRADQVRAAVIRVPRGMTVRVIDDPEHGRGSLGALWAARDVLRQPALVVDGDVVIPREALRRLLAAPAPSALLVDGGLQDTGEEIKVYARGERVIAVGEKVVPERWDTVGESVGLFKCGAEAIRALHQTLSDVRREGGGLGEWPDAVHALAAGVYVGTVDATGLPWTEIDFVEDLRRAETEVWPRIVALDGG
jgi:choline kinase